MGLDAKLLVRRVPAMAPERLKALSWRLCEAIGAGHFLLSRNDAACLAIDRTLIHYREDDDPQPGSRYNEIVADAGECLLEVSLFERYYGIGYERGDILILCAIAEWLEQNIPGCEVWYGHDCSDDMALFDDASRRELRQHLYSPAGRAYYRRFDPMPDPAAPLPPACERCPHGRYQGTRCGWGPSYARYDCMGCGTVHTTTDDGQSWSTAKEPT